MKDTVIDIRVWLLAIWTTIIAGFCLGTMTEQMGQDIFKPKSMPIDVATRIPRTPAGQHLLVDMNGVDSDFLSSKDLVD